MTMTRRRVILVVIVVVVAAVCAVDFAVDSSNHESNCEFFKQAAQVDFQAGRLAESQAKFERAVKEAEQSRNAMQLPMVLAGLAGVYEKRNELSKAEACLVRALEKYQKLYGADTQTVDRGTKLLLLRKIVEAEIALARIQRTEKHLVEARKTYENALEHEREDPDPHQLESIALIREYIAVLYQLGETELARETEIESESNFATSGDYFKFTKRGTDALFNCNLTDAEQSFRIAYLIAKNHHQMDRAASALAEIATCKIAAKKYTDAEKVLQEARSINPENNTHVTVKTQQLLAYTYYLLEQKENGDRLLAEALAIDPVLAVSPEAFATIRLFYNIVGEKSDHIVLCKMIISWHERLTKVHPTRELYAMLMDEYCSARMGQKCIDTFKKMNKLMGKRENEIDHLNIFQCSNLAQAYNFLGDNKEEIRYWKRAHQLLPRAPQLRFMISRALAYSLFNSKEPGHEKETISLLQDEWQMVDNLHLTPPELEEDIKRLEILYTKIGKPRSRKELLKDANSLAVSKWKKPALSLWVSRELAHVYQDDFEWRNAIEVFKPLIAEAKKQGSQPEVLDAETRLVWCLQMNGQLGEAAAIAKEVLVTECKKEYWSTRLKSHCLYNLGIIYAKEGKRELALKTFEEGKQMGPDIETSLGWAAMGACALSLAKQNEMAEIICLNHLDYAKKLLSKPTTGVAILMNSLADTYTADKKFSEADVYYKKSLDEFAKLEGPDVRALEANCRNHYQISLIQRK